MFAYSAKKPWLQVTSLNTQLNAASMRGTVNLTSLLTAFISLSQFCSCFWKSHNRGVYLLLFEQMTFVVLSHSVLLKLTQLWQLPLLRNPEMWKGPLFVRFKPGCILGISFLMASCRGASGVICVRSSCAPCTPLRWSERPSQHWQLCYLRQGRSIPPDCKSARRSVLLSWYFINLHQTRRHCHGWQRGQSRVLLSSQLR